MLIRSFIIAVCILNALVCSYIIPDPTIERLTPRGIRVSIFDEPGVQFFAFHAKINDPIEINESGTIAGESKRSRDNRWIFEDKNFEIGSEDILHYWIYVQANSSPYTRLGNETFSGKTSVCEKSISAIRGKLADCRGSLIFEETFDKEIDTEGSTSNNSSWTREMKMPMDPDYEFCVYRELPSSLIFSNGIMGIVPQILDDVYGDNITLFGRMQLEPCTGSLPLECDRRGIGSSILPPVISARLTTKESFYFRYGKIEIRAKFANGDWLYPELWLEPERLTNGNSYSNGRVILGMARGNEYLTKSTNSGTKNYGPTSLEFGLRTGSTKNIREDRVTRRKSLGTWNDDFHVYTTIWNAEGFKFQVDGEDVGKIEPPPGGWLNSDNSGENTGEANNMAPYDNEFYITIGLGVGGIRVFPDSTMSGRHAKPWRNIEAKAMLNFWLAKDKWLPTWRGQNGETMLKLDYVRVWSV